LTSEDERVILNTIDHSVKTDKGEAIVEYLSEEELSALLGQVNTRYLTGKRNLGLLMLMAETGLRVSEALGIDERDLEREGGQLTGVAIRNGKGGKQARVVLTNGAAAKLAAWLEARAGLGIEGGPVFCTITKGNRGSRIKREYVWQVCKRLADRAGIEKNVSPHVLRHSYAMRLMQKGMSLGQLKGAMRHSRIATTIDVYGSHATDEGQQQAVALLNGDSDESKEPTLEQQVAALQEQVAKLTAAVGGEQ